MADDPAAEGAEPLRDDLVSSDDHVNSIGDVETDVGAAPSAHSAQAPPDVAEELRRAIEGEMIPRLMLAHRLAEASGAADAKDGAALKAEDVDAFLDTVLDGSSARSLRFVDDVIARGVARESVYLDLLAVAAQRLGEMWETDVRSFTDVTLGLIRLHEVVRDQSAKSSPRWSDTAPVGKVLLGNALGDQHILGVVIVGEFFRQAGWRVSCEPGRDRAQLAALLAGEPFDVLGLSASTTTREALGDEITALREASRNPDLKVIVGGVAFAERPSLASEAGADGWSVDARDAPAAAEMLLASLRNRC
ncbi:MAG: B12-binding domain-containing protein [Parvularculaceae bacterium]